MRFFCLCLFIFASSLQGTSFEYRSKIEKKIEDLNNKKYLSVQEGVKFFESIIEYIYSEYGVNVSFMEALHLMRGKILEKGLSLEATELFLLLTNLFEFESFSPPSLGFEAQTAFIKGFDIWVPWFFLGMNKKQPSYEKKTSVSQPRQIIANMSNSQQEFVLPDKLAAGFMVAFAGAVLCVVPGGQNAGLALIGTGLGLAIDGMASGERPYYVNLETGNTTPFP